MNRILLAALLLGMAGCGGSSGTNDPSKLPPLTEADKKEIQERDAAIEAEEKGTPYVKK